MQVQEARLSAVSRDGPAALPRLGAGQAPHLGSPAIRGAAVAGQRVPRLVGARPQQRCSLLGAEAPQHVAQAVRGHHCADAQAARLWGKQRGAREHPALRDGLGRGRASRWLGKQCAHSLPCGAANTSTASAISVAAYQPIPPPVRLSTGLGATAPAARQALTFRCRWCRTAAR